MILNSSQLQSYMWVWITLLHRLDYLVYVTHVAIVNEQSKLWKDYSMHVHFHVNIKHAKHVHECLLGQRTPLYLVYDSNLVAQVQP